ncbi:MAG: AI-2E family transporter [Bacteroidales bacterium]|nr:AI-2E family transporter [Bacteroidales bacterium]
MSTTTRYIFYAIGIIFVVFLIWYFSNIVIYVLVSLVLALIGNPLFKLLEKVKIGRFNIPAAIRALVTLLVIFTVILLFFGFFIPLVVNKAQELSRIDPQRLLDEFQGPLQKIEQFINTYKIRPESYFSIEEMIQTATSKINVSQLAKTFGSIAGWLGNTFIAIFAIAFITFFFLKDEKLFSNAMLSLISDKHVEAASNAMNTSNQILSRYIIGVLIEMLSIIILSTTGLLIIGFTFRDAILVGFLAGIFNVIPYLGPVIGTILGLLIGILTYFSAYSDRNLIVLIILILIVFSIVQLCDNIIIQPVVYSRGVYAHPLEIFIVFLIAGSLGGFIGMILAIPSYTVLRIFAKEFFNNFKAVRSITRNI